MSVWSEQGGWSPEEQELLSSRFGEDVSFEIIQRSPIDPTLVLTWVAWDFQHPEIYAIDFKERTKYDTIGGEDFPTVAAARANEKWGPYFPEPAAEVTNEGTSEG